MKKNANTRNLLIGAGLVALPIAAIAYTNRAVKSIDRFTYSFKDLTFDYEGAFMDYLLNGLRFNLEVQINNPTNTYLEFQELKIDLIIDAQTITDVSVFRKIKIPANNYVVVPSTIHVPLVGLGSQLLKMFQDITNVASTEAQLKGYIKVSGIKVDIDEPILIKNPSNS